MAGAGVKSGMHTMRLELEEAKSKEAQLMADLATAGELTQEISRLVNIYIYTRLFISGLGDIWT